MPSNNDQNQQRNSTTPPSTPPPKPWQRQPDESAAAYRAFCLYRDLGPSRSLRRAYAIHQASGRQRNSGKSQKGCKRDTKHGALPGRWCLWSAEHSWLSRVEAFDEQVQCPEYQLELRRIERKRHAQAAYEDILNRLIDNLSTELPYLLFTPRTTTKMDGSKVTVRAVSPTAIATLLREIRQFEYVVQNGFQSKPPRPPAIDIEPPLEQPIQPEPSRDQRERFSGERNTSQPTPPAPTHDYTAIDLETLSAHLVERLREQSIVGNQDLPGPSGLGQGEL